MWATSSGGANVAHSSDRTNDCFAPYKLTLAVAATHPETGRSFRRLPKYPQVDGSRSSYRAQATSVRPHLPSRYSFVAKRGRGENVLARCALFICALLAGCAKEPLRPEAQADSSAAGLQGFTLGAGPSGYERPGTLRYLVSVPRPYLDYKWHPNPMRTDVHGRIIANAIRFGVEYPSLQPAQNAWAKGSIRITIQNIVEDGLSRSVDGSWLNYYSGYSIDLPDEFGLHVRRRPDGNDFPENRLYFRISRTDHVRIECQVNLNEADRWCVMSAKRPGEPVLDTGFYAAALPHWQERLERVRKLFKAEGQEPLHDVHSAS
jgi:hypothetical protein